MEKRNFTVLYLKDFKGGLHLARGLSDSYDKSLRRLHSDSLKSALYACALQLFGEEINEDFLKAFKISSAFPFLKIKEDAAEKYVHFFPRPQLPQLPFDLQGADKKVLKKISYFSQALLEDYLQDPHQCRTFSKEDHIGAYLGKEGSNLQQDFQQVGCTALYTSQPYQHVFIPRGDGQDSKPYFVDKIYFDSHAGLFVLLETADKAIEEKVKAAFRLLADNGVGTDRNMGNGQFSAGFGALSLTLPPSSSYQVSLSLYLPSTPSEIEGQLGDSYFGIVRRGGYISSPQDEAHLSIRKKSTYMFDEGAVFPCGDHHRTGQVIDLQPDEIDVGHPIYRDGQPIWLPIAL